MRNENNTNNQQHKTTIAAHLEMMLMIFTLAAVIFAAGYYVAAVQIAQYSNCSIQAEGAVTAKTRKPLEISVPKAFCSNNYRFLFRFLCVEFNWSIGSNFIIRGNGK